jgi:hypothetical protein
MAIMPTRAESLPRVGEKPLEAALIRFALGLVLPRSLGDPTVSEMLPYLLWLPDESASAECLNTMLAFIFLSLSLFLQLLPLFPSLGPIKCETTRIHFLFSV